MVGGEAKTFGGERGTAFATNGRRGISGRSQIQVHARHIFLARCRPAN